MSRWKKSPFPLSPPTRTSWPIESAPKDPYRSEERELHIASYEIQRQRMPLTEARFIELEEQFIAQYNLLLQSQKDNVDIHKTISSLGLSTSLKHETAEPFIGKVNLHNDFLSNIAEDLVPDIGVFALERVFGPMSERLQKYSSLAGAVLCFSPCMYGNYTPAGKICRKKPRFSKTINLTLTALAKTPTMLWQIEPNGEITPLLPLAKQFVPTTKVHNLPTTDQMIARVMFSEEGPTACCVLPLSKVDPQPVYARLWLEWIRLTRHSSHIFWEDLLRYYGDLLYRNCCEQWFLHQES